MSKPFDLTKPVQTRDGRPARIICTDKVGFGCPILALVTNGGQEEVATYTEAGKYLSDDDVSGSDLVNIPQKVTKYGVMDKDFNQLFGSVYDTEADAAKVAIFSRRVVTITWEE